MKIKLALTQLNPTVYVIKNTNWDKILGYFFKGDSGSTDKWVFHPAHNLWSSETLVSIYEALEKLNNPDNYSLAE